LLNEILEENKNLEPPINIEEIIINKWIIIEYLPLNKINGMCFRWWKWWYIAVNSLLNEYKIRFTLAHEFAHVLQEDIWFSSCLISKFDYKEIETDEFASNILVPQKALIEQLEYTQDAWVLAKVFQVEKTVIKQVIKKVL